VPHQPGHPDHQQLAAFQAGELDRRERARLETHLGACADCAGLLAGAEQARQLLAAVPLEPELPPGLHERLEAAVRRELATDRHRLAPVVLPASAPAWYRRRGALGLLGAAAVLLLLVALVPKLHLGGSPKAASTASGSVARPATPGALSPEGAAGAASRALVVINAPAGFSAQDLQARLATDPSVRAAFDAARSSAVPAPNQPQPKNSAQAQPGTGTATAPSTGAGALNGSSGNAVTAVQAACVAAASRLAPGSRPALLVHTRYQGKPAIVVVAVAPASGSGVTTRATLLYFAGGSCGQQTIRQEETTVTLP